MSKDKDTEAFRADVARAFGAIGRSLEVMQANLFITRAVVDLLDERDFLQIGDVRAHAHRMAQEAGMAAGAIDALQQLLGDEMVVPAVLQ